MKAIYGVISIFFICCTGTLAHTDELKRILIVPGHDNKHSGAVFGNVREVTLNRIVAQHLGAELESTNRAEVIYAHDDNDFNSILKAYFSDNKKKIETFRKQAQKEFSHYTQKENIKLDEGVPHARAVSEVAERLYGINMWANENNINLVIHVHFNDYGSRSRWGGEYTGFSVYVPHREYQNAEQAIDIGNDIYNSLIRINFPSNNPTEAKYNGAIEDHELIALGVHNTLEVPSVLIEYAYIYESHLQGDFFDRVAREYAYQTVRGLKEFLGSDTLYTDIGAYEWKNNMKKDLQADPSLDVFMLQTALRTQGYYPSSMHTQDTCPITGIFGPCTEQSLKEFQKSQGIISTGYLGQQTRAVLNRLY